MDTTIQIKLPGTRSAQVQAVVHKGRLSENIAKLTADAHAL
jgi:hypothetical protein